MTETLQQTNPLLRGSNHLTSYGSAAPIVTPATVDKHNSGAYTVPGNDIFSYSEWLFPNDNEHRTINVEYEEEVLYRSNASSRVRDGSNYRIRTTSVTSPNGATFIDGNTGDNY